MKKEYTSATAVLLAENKKALQFLHVSESFDFEKPYTVHTGTGNITWGKIKKLIPDGYRAALLVSPYDYRGETERLHYVKITDSRFEPRTGDCSASRMAMYYHGIEYFFNVSSFEEKRKFGFAAWYLVTQAAEYKNDGRTGAPRDLFGRWEVLNQHTTYNSGTKERYIIEMTLRTAEGGNSAAWKYKPCYSYTADLRAVIDASGYLLKPRKEEQRRKLFDLKKAKAAKALAAADFSILEARAFAALADARGTLAGELQKAQNSKEIYAISDKLRRLHWAMHDLELYESRKAAGKLESCATVEKTLTDIIKKAGEIVNNEDA